MEEFDSEFFGERTVLSRVDGTHTTTAESLENLVTVSEGCAWFELGGHLILFEG